MNTIEWLLTAMCGQAALELWAKGRKPNFEALDGYMDAQVHIRELGGPS